MPSLEIHYQKSLARTGKDYHEIHNWIDEPSKKKERHDLGKILETANMWTERFGAEGAREYLHHLQDDVESRFNHLLEDMQKITQENLAYFGCLTEKQS
ncbi:MAG: hypothetical protein HQL93_12290 [Magnetococcales bacterium]|nr:hypothetical protein [Magnetococcales bacterium]